MTRVFRTRWLTTLMLLLLLATVSVAAQGQDRSSGVTQHTIEDVDNVLDATQKEVKALQDRLQNKPHEVDDMALVRMRDRLQEVQGVAADIVVQQEPELESVEARLSQLGAPAQDAPEPPDIAQQRAQLTQRQTTLDAQIKLARLLVVEAKQGQDKVSRLRRARFQAELGKRSYSILTTDLWRDIRRDLPRDVARLSVVLSEFIATVRTVPARVWATAAVLGVGLLLLSAVAHRRLIAFTVRHTLPTRLRRSIFAFLTVVLYTVVPGLTSTVLLHVLRWSGKIEAGLDTFLVQCVTAIYVAGFVAGLGAVLLSPARSSWRLPQISDRLARKLAGLPVLFAITIALAWAVQRLLELVNASLSTTVLVNGLMTVALNILIGFTAWKLRSSVKNLAWQGDAGDAAQRRSSVSAWARGVPSVLVVVIAASLAAFILGFVALSNLIAQEIIWLTLIGCTAYLIVVLVTDIFDTLIGRVHDELKVERLTPQQARVRGQLLVLASGGIRLALVFLSITLLLLPFGEAPGQWLDRRLGFLTAGFQVGEVVIKPTSILLTLTVLLVGIYSVKVLRSWLVSQLLPMTRLDECMRVPTANLLGYLAYFGVGMVAVSSLGIGLERMAWIVSALSVGIGFGLQAVVQNFVSGVILVAERPIKVGDWVSLDGVEGNVREISARATEIELFDRSTMIVPNSEFITKKVRNVTMANPLGVVALKFNMPVNVNADAVRSIMLSAMEEQSEVLADPPAMVMLDGFNESSLAFSASCYVSSPRNASRVRSTLMFDILGRLRRADLTLHPVQPVTVETSVSPETKAAAKESM